MLFFIDWVAVFHVTVLYIYKQISKNLIKLLPLLFLLLYIDLILAAELGKALLDRNRVLEQALEKARMAEEEKTAEIEVSVGAWVHDYAYVSQYLNFFRVMDLSRHKDKHRADITI